MDVGDPKSDAGVRAEFNRLRSELRELELQMMDRNLRLAQLWVVAIFLASLALAVAIIGSLLAKS